MRRIEFGGGTYADALTDGRFAVAMADRFITNAREVPFPPSGGVLHHRVGIIDGTFCIAGQGHNDGLAWLWSGDVWRPLGTSYGTSVAAFGPVGVYVSTPNAVDNIKIFNINGEQIGAISKDVGARGIAAITGEGIAPDDVKAVDKWYGHGGLAEYTDVGDGVLIGQGANGGLVIKHDSGQPSIIEPGHVEFCRASDDSGQVFVASAWKTQERKAVICWFDRRDLLSMPRVQPLIDPPPPPPPPDPEPEPKPVIPDHFHVVSAINDAHPHLLAKNDHESVKEFYWRAAWALHLHDPRWGMLSKSGGETGHEIDGAGRVAEDAVAYKDVTPIVDIIAGANNPPHRAGATWQVVEQRRESNKWVKPPQFPDTVTPDPEPEPPPSGEDWKQEAHAIRELVRALRLEVLGQLERLQVCEGKADGAQSAGLIAYQKLVTIEERLRKGLPVQGNIGRSLGHAHGFSGKTQWTD
jgi:hypothetical protein